MGLSRLLGHYAGADVLFGGKPPAGVSPATDEETLRVASEMRLWETAVRGGGVILGRAGAVVLAGAPRALHVLLTGSQQARLVRLVDAGLVDPREAGRRLAAADSARAAYWRQGYGRDPDDLSLYHVVLDTAALPLDTCARHIAAFAREIGPAA